MLDHVVEMKLMIAKQALLKAVAMAQVAINNLEGLDTLPTVAQELKTDAQSLLDSVVSTHEAM